MAKITNTSLSTLTLIVSLALLLVGWGITLATISIKANDAHTTATNTSKGCTNNIEQILIMQGDLKYIKETVTEIKQAIKPKENKTAER